MQIGDAVSGSVGRRAVKTNAVIGDGNRELNGFVELRRVRHRTVTTRRQAGAEPPLIQIQ